MVNKKAGKIFALSILALLMVSFFVGVVSAASSLETQFINSEFYKFISQYLVPAGMEGFTGLIIGIISLTILFSVALDILSLVPIFNRTTTWIIAIGIGIIMVVTKLNVTAAGWLFGIGAVLFGWAGTIGVFLTILIGIGLLIGLFYGNYWLTNWLVNMRTSKENAEKVREGGEAGGDIARLRRMAREAEKG